MPVSQTESREVASHVTASILDHFAVLGVNRSYALDIDELETRYLERSKKVHPDRFVNAEASQRVAALSSSMQLNESYKLLRSAAKRAEHLLALHGASIDGNEKLDPTFLMAILEAREELSEALAQGDRDEVARLEDSMLERKDVALDQVATLFAEIEAGQSANERLMAIKRELIILRYVERYLEAIEID